MLNWPLLDRINRQYLIPKSALETFTGGFSLKFVAWKNSRTPRGEAERQLTNFSRMERTADLLEYRNRRPETSSHSSLAKPVYPWRRKFRTITNP